MSVETPLGISSVLVQTEVNGDIVPEPGQNVIAVVEPPFTLSLRRQTAGTAESAESVLASVGSVPGRFRSIAGSVFPEVKSPGGSERIRSRGGGRRPRCSRCRGRHYSAGECKVGLPGSTSPTFTSQLLTFSLSPQLI